MTDARELPARRGILLAVAVALATAVLGGLVRLGFDVGLAWPAMHAMDHGPLFVLGVFGTVIGLERAVAYGAAWGYAAPLVGVAGALASLAGMPGAAWGATVSSVALLTLNAAIVARQSVAFTWLMLLGSAVLVFGNATLAVGRPVFAVVPAWIAFFVLTIVAERLELSRLAPTPRWATRTLVALSLVFAASCCAMVAGDAVAFGDGPSTRVTGASMMLLALWQLRFDLARRTIRLTGLPRYAATGVLLGALWLLVAGSLLATRGLPPAGPAYDAALHAVFVGFVLSMVFAHAPIILPAVARIEVPFHPGLYVPLVMLHLGLVARVWGDVAGVIEARRFGGMANAVALPLFLGAVLWARRVGKGRSR